MLCTLNLLFFLSILINKLGECTKTTSHILQEMQFTQSAQGFPIQEVKGT